MELKITSTAEREHLFPAWVDGRETSLHDDYKAAHDRIAASITGADLIDELVDVQDAVAHLAKKGDVEAIGCIVVSVHRAFVRRLADGEIFGKPGRDSQTATEAAAEALGNLVSKHDVVRNALIRAHLKAQQERF